MINAYSQVLILICHSGLTKNERLFYNKTLSEEDRTFHLSQFLVLEYQHNYGSLNLVLEYQI